MPAIPDAVKLDQRRPGKAMKYQTAASLAALSRPDALILVQVY